MEVFIFNRKVIILYEFKNLFLIYTQRSDANDHPLIEANYFAVDFDAVIQTNGLKSNFIKFK